MVLAGDADRGIEWGRACAPTEPFDPVSYGPLLSITLGRFERGKYEAAAEAAHKTFQANPHNRPIRHIDQATVIISISIVAVRTTVGCASATDDVSPPPTWRVKQNREPGHWPPATIWRSWP
jgi:hypothetical protein